MTFVDTYFGKKNLFENTPARTHFSQDELVKKIFRDYRLATKPKRTHLNSTLELAEPMLSKNRTNVAHLKSFPISLTKLPIQLLRGDRIHV